MRSPVYVYIDIQGKIGKSYSGPTEADLQSVADGQLTVLQIETNQHGHLFVEEYDPSIEDDEKWCDIQAAQTDTDDGGNEYHFVL